MNSMFRKSKFDGDLSTWNVKQVTNMKYMFDRSKLVYTVFKWKLHAKVDMLYFSKVIKSRSDFEKEKNAYNKLGCLYHLSHLM